MDLTHFVHPHVICKPEVKVRIILYILENVTKVNFWGFIRCILFVSWAEQTEHFNFCCYCEKKNFGLHTEPLSSKCVCVCVHNAAFYLLSTQQLLNTLVLYYLVNSTCYRATLSQHTIRKNIGIYCHMADIHNSPN
jgi:hypothetical protein